MSSNWEKIGEDIRKTVQDAIENQNYDKLNQVVTDTLNQTVNAVSKGVKKAVNTSGIKYTNVKNEVKSVQVNHLVKVPSKAGALAVSAVGFILGGSQLLAFIIGLVATLLFDAAFGASPRIMMAISSAFSAVLSGAGFYLGVQGTKRYQRIERLKSYLSAIGNKEYCNVSELCEKVGKSAKTV